MSSGFASILWNSCLSRLGMEQIRVRVCITYKNSPTWNKIFQKQLPSQPSVSEASQQGRHDSSRYVYIYICPWSGKNYTYDYPYLARATHGSFNTPSNEQLFTTHSPSEKETGKYRSYPLATNIKHHQKSNIISLDHQTSNIIRLIIKHQTSILINVKLGDFRL